LKYLRQSRLDEFQEFINIVKYFDTIKALKSKNNKRRNKIDISRLYSSLLRST